MRVLLAVVLTLVLWLPSGADQVSVPLERASATTLKTQRQNELADKTAAKTKAENDKKAFEEYLSTPAFNWASAQILLDYDRFITAIRNPSVVKSSLAVSTQTIVVSTTAIESINTEIQALDNALR